MTYVREVTKLTCIVVCVYISRLTQFAYFLSLFILAIQCIQCIDSAATCVFLMRYSNASAGAGYTFTHSSIYTLAYIDYFYRGISLASIA